MQSLPTKFSLKKLEFPTIFDTMTSQSNLSQKKGKNKSYQLEKSNLTKALQQYHTYHICFLFFSFFFFLFFGFLYVLIYVHSRLATTRKTSHQVLSLRLSPIDLRPHYLISQKVCPQQVVSRTNTLYLQSMSESFFDWPEQLLWISTWMKKQNKHQ